MLEWTGERYLPFIDPSISGAEIHYEHLHRYAFATQFVNGKKVLDLACGEGYGSFLLAKTARCVIGIDITPKTIQHASNAYPKDNLEFKEGSILNVPVSGSKRFDVIVCFEALEHIDEHTRLISEIMRLLKDDGLLIISTPNKKIYSDAPDYHNPFHKKELYFNEFKDLLKNNFSRVHFFGQRTITGSNIFSLSSKELQICTEFIIKKEKDEFTFKSADEKIPIYYVALATNVKSYDSFIAKSFLIDASNTEISLFSNQIASQNQQLLEMSNQVTNLNQTLESKDQQVLELSNQVTNLNQILESKDQQLLEFSNQVTNLNQTLESRDQQVLELSNQVTNLTQEITRLSEQFSILTEENNSIKNSISYRLLTKFHIIFIEPLFPHNSNRREIYDLGLKGGRILIKDGWKKFYLDFKNYQHTKRALKKLSENNKKMSLNYQQSELIKYESDPEKKFIEELNFFLSDQKRRVIFPKYENPIVSIIILTFNKASYTHQCLQSLLEHTEIPYEVLIVDNGSTDTTPLLLKQVDNVVEITHEKNLGFIIGCNEGAKKAKGKYLLFLNNDTEVTKNWLSRLVKTLETYSYCGAVGCKLVWPNGQLQEAGSIVWNDGSAVGYGRGDDPLKPEYSYLREVDYCSGACLLVRTDLFKKLDGFDERFIPAYYEDSDLCLGLQNLGYKIVYQPNVTIFHHEFTSSSRELAKNYMINNRSKFVEKWQDFLKIKEINSFKNILSARDARKGKKILVLDDMIPASNQGSGYPRANILLTYLGELGHRVTFFPLGNTTPWQPYTSQFQELGIEVFYGDYLNFETFSQQRQNFYDIIFVSRPHNFEKTYHIIKLYFPDAKLIYDAEALFSTREILKAKIQGISLNDDQIKKLRDNEFELMKKADIIITVSVNEKKIIQKNSGLENIIIFGHPVQIQNNIVEFNPRKDILFVGSFLAPNGPNDDAIIYFVKEVWPNVQKQLFCKLYIVGINPPDHIQKLTSPSIIVTGFVPNLKEFYNNCRVFVVPHRYAAGIPLKLIEAMSYGIPSVVSGLIASQLNLSNEQEVLISQNADDFIKNVIRLYQNQDLWNKLQKNSFEYIKKESVPEKIRDTIDQIVNTIP